MSELRKQAIRATASAVLVLTAFTSLSAPLMDANSVPQLDPAGRQAYRDFLSSPAHRAFAIAPGGYWSWQADQATADAAADTALQSCRMLVGHDCALYAIDERIVFDTAKWKQQWRPYLSGAEAMRAEVGSELEQRFYDLRFKDGRGRTSSISAQQGKVLILHFWGSWCPSCRTEMPDLVKLQRLLSRTKDVRLVLLQVREDYKKGKDWMKAQGLKLPLYDSGMVSRKDDFFTTTDGSNIKDRDIAPVFPSTYVLDKNGIVVFSHVGTITDWPSYLPLLQDLAEQSGKGVNRPLPNR